MAKSLVVVACAGLAISALSLSVASMLSPEDGMWIGPPGDDGWWDSSHGPWAERSPFTDSGDLVTREMAWTNGDAVEIDIPGFVSYEPAPDWRVTVKGRQGSVDQLRIDRGHIFFAGSLRSSGKSSIEVRVQGPELRSVALNGSGSLNLMNLSQEAIEIDVRGSGTVRGSGSVERLELRIFGSGEAELADLKTVDLDVSIFGSGDADVAPTGDAEISMFGSGNVRLRTTPTQLSTRSMGSGRVIQRGADASERS
ncbi:MAG: DUF2807 domain-containing protein [Gammaproteobacteria bacterium]